MNLSGQQQIKIGYVSSEETGLTTVTFSAPGNILFGKIVIETRRLKGFFSSLNMIFSERARTEEMPSDYEEVNKLLLRVHQGEADIGYAQ